MMEIVVILVLIGLNGVFAMSEIAVVSSRKPRLQLLADDGSRRARAALELTEDPGRFLSTVQIGITLIGVLAGAFGGVVLAADVEPLVASIGPLASYSEEIAFGVVVGAITYLSLTVGELVPKHLGLRHPERIAMLIARPMRGLSRAAAPLVFFLNGSTNIVLRLFSRQTPGETLVTAEEISFLLAEGAQAGVFEVAEQEIIKRVFRFADLPVAAVMTPRREVDWIRMDAAREDLHGRVVEHTHSRLVVCGTNLDDPVGIVHVKDLLSRLVVEGSLDVASVVRHPPYVPESAPALRALEHFKRAGEQMAIVVDEYGGMAGVVTLHDILEGIVGDIPFSGDDIEPTAVRRDDGSWLVEGMIPIEEFKDFLHIRELTGEETGSFHTLGGFVVTYLGHIPVTSESFVSGGFRYEVVDMDGRRVDKVLVAPVPPPVNEPSEGLRRD